MATTDRIRVGLGRVAVLLTDDIYTFRENLPGGEVKVVLPEGGGVLVSRGRLERALEEGYEVFVITTGRGFTDSDEWWRWLLPPEQVLRTPSRLEAAEAANPTPNIPVDWASLHRGESDGAFSARLATPWLELFRCLGLVYPLRPDGEPEFWTAARAVLAEAGAVVGRDLLGVAERRVGQKGGGDA